MGGIARRFHGSAGPTSREEAGRKRPCPSYRVDGVRRRRQARAGPGLRPRPDRPRWAARGLREFRRCPGGSGRRRSGHHLLGRRGGKSWNSPRSLEFAPVGLPAPSIREAVTLDPRRKGPFCTAPWSATAPAPGSSPCPHPAQTQATNIIRPILRGHGRHDTPLVESCPGDTRYPRRFASRFRERPARPDRCVPCIPSFEFPRTWLPFVVWVDLPNGGG